MTRNEMLHGLDRMGWMVFAYGPPLVLRDYWASLTDEELMVSHSRMAAITLMPCATAQKETRG